jgi:hypothetical protein
MVHAVAPGIGLAHCSIVRAKATSMPQQSPTDLIGECKTEQPLSDKDVAQLHEAEKMKKFG